jgi:hypothetical protein
MSVPFPISHSKLEIARCGLALQKYNEGDKEYDTPEFEFTEFGSESHAVIDEINIHKDQHIDDDLLNSFIKKHVTSDHVDIRKAALKYMTNFPYKNVLYSEYKFGLNESLFPCDYDQAAYRGRIDQIMMADERTMIVNDNKSSWQIYRPEVPQLDFYCWALSRTYPEIDGYIRAIYFIRHGAWQKSNYTLSQFANIENAFVIAAEQAWEQELGKPCPGKVCMYCRHAMSCPSAEASLDIIKSYEDALTMAQKYHVMQRQIGVMGKKLRKFVDTYGNIDLNDSEYYGYHETKRLVINARDVLDKLKKAPNLASLLKVSAMEYRKLPEDLKSLIPVEYKTSTKFMHGKKGEIEEEQEQEE